MNPVRNDTVDHDSTTRVFFYEFGDSIPKGHNVYDFLANLKTNAAFSIDDGWEKRCGASINTMGRIKYYGIDKHRYFYMSLVDHDGTKEIAAAVVVFGLDSKDGFLMIRYVMPLKFRPKGRFIGLYPRRERTDPFLSPERWKKVSECAYNRNEADTITVAMWYEKGIVIDFCTLFAAQNINEDRWTAFIFTSYALADETVDGEKGRSNRFLPGKSDLETQSILPEAFKVAYSDRNGTVYVAMREEHPSSSAVEKEAPSYWGIEQACEWVSASNWYMLFPNASYPATHRPSDIIAGKASPYFSMFPKIPKGMRDVNLGNLPALEKTIVEDTLWNSLEPLVTPPSIGSDRNMYHPSMVRVDAYGNVILRDNQPNNSPLAWQMDHVFPKSRGGKTVMDNFFIVHHMINNAKSDAIGSTEAGIPVKSSRHLEHREETQMSTGINPIAFCVYASSVDARMGSIPFRKVLGGKGGVNPCIYKIHFFDSMRPDEVFELGFTLFMLDLKRYATERALQLSKVPPGRTKSKFLVAGSISGSEVASNETSYAKALARCDYMVHSAASHQWDIKSWDEMTKCLVKNGAYNTKKGITVNKWQGSSANRYNSILYMYKRLAMQHLYAMRTKDRTLSRFSSLRSDRVARSSSAVISPVRKTTSSAQNTTPERNTTMGTHGKTNDITSYMSTLSLGRANSHEMPYTHDPSASSRSSSSHGSSNTNPPKSSPSSSDTKSSLFVSSSSYLTQSKK